MKKDERKAMLDPDRDRQRERPTVEYRGREMTVAHDKRTHDAMYKNKRYDNPAGSREAARRAKRLMKGAKE